jgi:hypothetical protein
MLNLLLIVFDPVLVLFQSRFNLVHVLFIRIDELSLLSLEHHPYLPL